MADTPPTDAEIRTAIANTIRTSLSTAYAQSPLQIRVYNHWILNLNIGEIAASLTVREGSEAGLIHGWLVGLQSVSRERPAKVGRATSAYDLREVGSCRRDIVRKYRIWGFYQLDTGTLGNEDTTNSETLLAEELEIIADAFSNNPTLGIVNSCMRGHTELQFGNVDVFSFGDYQANVAQGTLDVLLVHNLTGA